MKATPNATPSADRDAADGEAMLVVLRVDAILAGQRFKAGTTIAVSGEMLPLAHALLAADAAVPAAKAG